MFDFFDQLFAKFGLVIENRNAPQFPGVRQVRDHAAISSIFAGDAIREQADSMYFNQGRSRRVTIASNAGDLGASPEPRRR